jgi:hypothetical protein
VARNALTTSSTFGWNASCTLLEAGKSAGTRWPGTGVMRTGTGARIWSR